MPVMPYLGTDFEHEARDSLSSAREEAARIRRETTEEAQRILDQARREGQEEGVRKGHEEGLAAGREEGRQAGLQEGLQDCAQKTESLAQALKAATGAFNAEKEALMEGARADLLRLALTMARRVIRREINMDDQVALRAVEEAVTLVADRSDMVISVHPADLDILKQAHNELVARMDQARHIRFEADADISRGGCVVRTAGGAVDIQVESQLENMERALLGGEDTGT